MPAASISQVMMKDMMIVDHETVLWISCMLLTFCIITRVWGFFNDFDRICWALRVFGLGQGPVDNKAYEYPYICLDCVELFDKFLGDMGDKE